MSLTPVLPHMTERLELRATTPSDAEALYRYKSDPDTCRYLPHPPLSLDEVRDKLASPWSRLSLEEAGQAVMLAVVVRETGDLIGEAVLIWQSERDECIEIGYGLRRDAVGHGYASEAAAALMQISFDEWGMHRVMAHLDGRNTASARVCERIGMRREAHHLSAQHSKGEWVSTLVYAMTAEEWAARPRP